MHARNTVLLPLSTKFDPMSLSDLGFRDSRQIDAGRQSVGMGPLTLMFHRWCAAIRWCTMPKVHGLGAPSQDWDFDRSRQGATSPGRVAGRGS